MGVAQIVLIGCPEPLPNTTTPALISITSSPVMAPTHKYYTRNYDELGSDRCTHWDRVKCHVCFLPNIL